MSEWIPVSERLPNKEGRYLCTVGASFRNPREMYYAPQAWADNSDHATWKSDDGSYVYDWFVIAWMPLPEPYEKGKSMRETELGLLKVGDMFYFNGYCYKTGHSDGRGYIYCTNVKTRKVKRIHLTTLVEVEYEHID